MDEKKEYLDGLIKQVMDGCDVDEGTATSVVMMFGGHIDDSTMEIVKRYGLQAGVRTAAGMARFAADGADRRARFAASLAGIALAIDAALVMAAAVLLPAL